jgi:hypothetical protein
MVHTDLTKKKYPRLAAALALQAVGSVDMNCRLLVSEEVEPSSPGQERQVVR